MSRMPLAALAALAALAVPTLATAGTPATVDPTVPAARDADYVVLTGAQFGIDGSWAVPANLTARQPEADLTECPEQSGSPIGGCPDGYDPHSHYAQPTLDTATVTGDAISGTPTNKLL